VVRNITEDGINGDLKRATEKMTIKVFRMKMERQRPKHQTKRKQC